MDIRDYREQGYLPEAILNYMVRLGWSHGDQEIFSIDEMIEHFDIEGVNHSASSFNPEKLLWINQQHIINASAERLGQALVPFLEEAGLDPLNGPAPRDVADGFRERAETLRQMAQSARYCYEDFDEIDAKAAKKNLRPVILGPLKAVRDAFAALPAWTQEVIAKTIEEMAASFEINMGKLGQPIRVAVTGGSVSPPLDVTLMLVGQDKTIARLDSAIEFIKVRALQATD